MNVTAQAQPATTTIKKAGAAAVERLKPSKWIWLPYVWLMIASTRSIGTWLAGGRIDRALSDLSDEAGSPVDRAVLIALIVLSLVVLISRSERTKRILARNKWLMVLFGYMLLSVFWSNFPAISFRRWIRAVGALLTVLVVLTEEDPLGGIRSLLKRVYLTHIPLSIITIKYFRNIGVAYTWDGVEEMWTGLANHKNNLGQVAMCSGLYSSWQVFRDWSKKKLTLDLLLLLMTLYVLRGSKNSHSSTAILGFLCGAALLVALQFMRKRAKHAKRIILGATIAMTIAAPLMMLGFEAFDTSPMEMVANATGRDLTLSDRTLLWTDLLNNARSNPVLGVGYGAFWVGSIGYERYPLPNWSRKTPEWRPNEGHDGYIDVYVDLGVVGVVLLVIVLACSFSGALNDLQNDFARGSLRIALLLSIVINNIAESSFLKGTHSLWFVFLLVGINLPISKKPALQDAAP